MVSRPEQAVVEVIACANELAGEKFGDDVPLTQLSGGQSRALMIADTAVLSSLPVVLIDEIENAGIDRRRALDLLIAREKITLISTHDPILALMGDRRIVIGNGAVVDVIAPGAAEKVNLAEGPRQRRGASARAADDGGLRGDGDADGSVRARLRRHLALGLGDVRSRPARRTRARRARPDRRLPLSRHAGDAAGAGERRQSAGLHAAALIGSGGVENV
jgi:hypothetical protein